MPSLSNRRIYAAEDAESLVRLLLEAGSRLPPRLRERILAFGPQVVPPLVALVEDEALANEDAPGEGFAPVHAVELLGELGAADAAGPMLRVLTRMDWDTLLHDRVLTALPRLGAAALEPTLAAYAGAVDSELKGDLCSVLADLEIQDERIYQALVEGLRNDLGAGAASLGKYGDDRALPLLIEELDRYESLGDDFFANSPLAELITAIEDLGGTLTPDQQKKVDRIFANRPSRKQRIVSVLEQALGRMDLETSPVSGARALRGELPEPRGVQKVGRNAPCPCGSGQKYKKCCLGKE